MVSAGGPRTAKLTDCALLGLTLDREVQTRDGYTHVFGFDSLVSALANALAALSQLSLPLPVPPGFLRVSALFARPLSRIFTFTPSHVLHARHELGTRCTPCGCPKVPRPA